MEQKRTILLVDSSTELEIIKNKSKTGAQILTLDYDTHRILTTNNIEHEVSDNFLDEDMLEEIQNYAYTFAKWYDIPTVKEMLLYNGVNVGGLFYIELYVFLLEFLKRFYEIQQICLKYHDYKVLSSDTNHDYVRIFSKNGEVLNSKIQKQQFHYDSITFESKYYKIQLSYKNYLRLKKFLEKISRFFFNTKTNNDEIMLVEFNTIFYKELFYKLKDHVLFFGLRRPPIWNLHSYSIIRKSNSKLIFMSQLSTRELENKISEGMRHVKINFNKLFTNESLASFFVINGISIWELVKPSIENLISRHGEEAITNIEIIQKALTKFKPRKILILSESGQTEQIIIAKAKEVGIPVVRSEEHTSEL